MHQLERSAADVVPTNGEVIAVVESVHGIQVNADRLTVAKPR